MCVMDLCSDRPFLTGAQLEEDGVINGDTGFGCAEEDEDEQERSRTLCGR